MIKMQVLGNLGKDAVMHMHGTDSVLNFSVAHTEKYKDSSGQQVQKTTWVECSWWVDSRSTVGQYLKKGTMVWAEGRPDSRPWETREGKKASSLIMRVTNLQLCGGGNQQPPSQQSASTTSAPVNDQAGFVPLDTDNFDLPF
jgi:single-strand DNA-binding protein